ncbi:MAG: hypothetical protein QM730_03850 [Anaerolineales bacterium]
MSTLHRMFVILVLMALIASCTAPTAVQILPSPTRQPIPSPTAQPSLPETYIVRHPAPGDNIVAGGYYVLPKYDPASENALQIDLRSKDVSASDFSSGGDDLLYAAFDTRTVWPPKRKCLVASTGQRSWKMEKIQG